MRYKPQDVRRKFAGHDDSSPRVKPQKPSDSYAAKRIRRPAGRHCSAVVQRAILVKNPEVSVGQAKINVGREMHDREVEEKEMSYYSRRNSGDVIRKRRKELLGYLNANEATVVESRASLLAYMLLSSIETLKVVTANSTTPPIGKKVAIEDIEDLYSHALEVNAAHRAKRSMEKAVEPVLRAGEDSAKKLVHIVKLGSKSVVRRLLSLTILKLAVFVGELIIAIAGAYWGAASKAWQAKLALLVGIISLGAEILEIILQPWDHIDSKDKKVLVTSVSWMAVGGGMLAYYGSDWYDNSNEVDGFWSWVKANWLLLVGGGLLAAGNIMSLYITFKGYSEMINKCKAHQGSLKKISKNLKKTIDDDEELGRLVGYYK